MNEPGATAAAPGARDQPARSGGGAPATAERREIRVGLAGQPNVGKSTLFSGLTGATLETGNWPGKTVERREGRRTLGDATLHIVDLPGTYSLSASSEEERIARDYVLAGRPDVVALVIDASSMERGLYLLAELLHLPAPVVVALNMTDVAERSGKPVDAERLAEALGVPVVPTVARSGQGLDALAAELARYGSGEESLGPVALEVDGDAAVAVQRALEVLARHVPEPYTPGFVARKLVEGDDEFVALARQWVPEDGRAEVDAFAASAAEHGMALAGARYAWAGQAAKAAQGGAEGADARRTWTDRFDAVALHPFAGVALLGVMSWIVYQATLELAGPLQDLLDGWISGAGAWLGAKVAPLAGWTEAFVTDGLFGSVGLLITFLPVLAVFFLAFALLEDSGYMARAAFVLDRFLGAIGLRGKSFLPMFVGAGCNVPAVFGARVIESRSARLLTILLTPLVPCSARLIVLALLVPAFFASHAAGVSVGLIGLNIAVIAMLGLILSRTMFRGERQSFVMELPRYSLPSARSVSLSVLSKLRAFLKDAGTMIVVIALAVWALSAFPGDDIGDSYLASAGRWLEPLGAPMDMDWRLIVAILTGFIAKEVVIATLGVLYATSSEEGLVATMTAEISPATALAFLVITMLFIPCVGTVAAMRREAGTRWMLFGTAMLLVVSWGFGIGVYEIADALGLGDPRGGGA